eukprot:3939649-Rhodomonas_salina.4
MNTTRAITPCSVRSGGVTACCGRKPALREGKRTASELRPPARKAQASASDPMGDGGAGDPTPHVCGKVPGKNVEKFPCAHWKVRVRPA